MLDIRLLATDAVCGYLLMLLLLLLMLHNELKNRRGKQLRNNELCKQAFFGNFCAKGDLGNSECQGGKIFNFVFEVIEYLLTLFSKC